MNDDKKISRSSFLKLLGVVIGLVMAGCGEQTIKTLEESAQTPDAKSIVTPPTPDATATFTSSLSATSVKTVPIENTATLEGKVISEPINVSDADFETAILQSKLPIIVEFWAPWCEPCKMLDSILEEIADEYAGRLIVARVDTDQNPIFTMKFGVTGIPTLIFFSSGKVVERQVGAPSEEKLRDLVERFLYIP